MCAANVVEVARSLRQQGRVEEADSMLAEAVAESPESEAVLGEYCWAAHLRRDWAEAARRWAIYRIRFTDLFLGYGLGSVALREAGQFEDAEIIAHDGLRRFPNHPEILANLAWVAHQRRDWPEALARWHGYIDAFPADALGYSGAGWVLREMYSFDEADEILLEGLRRHPDHPELLANYAWSAHQRMDWAEALQRWTAYQNHFPDQSLGQYQAAVALRQMGQFAKADEVAEQAALRSEDADTAQLMLRFESLGDNCEFGVVQRHFGADPLGLLRFTSTPWKSLADALGAGFPGVGEIENTKLLVIDGEFLTTDARYHMGMHTFVRDTGDDHGKRLVSFCRRLVFLKDKLIRDLSDGTKIFVYGCADHLSDEDAGLLWRSLQIYGNNRLLLVQAADEANASGDVRAVREGLMIGYLPTFNVESPAFDVWLGICQRTLRAFGPEGS